VNKEDKKELLVKFGGNLRKLRLEKGFSQEHLANELGVEVSQISRIERGQINTSIAMLYDISKALEINISDFFEFE
jgi:transcriptional regulator with XRE-family HTH domain